MSDKLGGSDRVPAPGTAPPSRHLDSWKEIAKYLQRDVRTTQRWEIERGLPVHRVPGGKRQGVFAIPEEIDAWLIGRAEHLESSHDADTRFGGKALRTKWGIIVAAVLLGSLGFARLYLPERAGTPVRADIVGQEIRTWDSQGRPAWSFQFPDRINAPTDNSAPERYSVFVDLDGDGTQELVVAPSAATEGDTEQIYCFDAAGNLLWTYKPKLSLRFGDRNFDGPWQTSDLHVIRGKQPAIWISYHHSIWWPSFLVRINAEGDGEIRFVHAGWMLSLSSLQNSSGTYILAGGVSNEREAGMLSVLPEIGPPAYGPIGSNPEFDCRNCPAAGPLRYFVFPRSEINRILSPSYNLVQKVFRISEGAQARTVEVQDMPPYHMRSEGAYDISRDLRITRAGFTDIYWNLHRRLEEDGKLNHRALDCPERPAPVVREWTREAGWSSWKPPQPILSNARN